MPPYIISRLTRTHATPLIVPQSTPVLGFGDFFSAEIATIGLNPSKYEFLSRNGVLLSGAKLRLQTLPSLGLSAYTIATPAHHQAVLNSCLKYFHGNPYSSWFGRFNPILNICGVSYHSGTACHLDLVQTATDPVWSGLSKSDQARYIANDSWFLIQQLSNHNISKVLLNGRSVVDNFCRIFGLTLNKSSHHGPLGQPFDIFTGQLNLNGRIIEVCGWNINIQSSHIKGGAPTAAIAAVLAPLCRPAHPLQNNQCVAHDQTKS